MSDKSPKKAKKVTPMMKQYNEIKAANPGTILLYRMGDFYELFNEDAKVAASLLGITLTKRNHGGADPTPLAGFPHHALDRYAHKLVKAGYRIAICEQVEDPKKAKGIVKRDIIEVITAGTGMDDTFISEDSNNYIASLYNTGDEWGISFCDLSTGEFATIVTDSTNLQDEIARIDPSEVLFPENLSDSTVIETVKEFFTVKCFTPLDDYKFDLEKTENVLKEHFAVNSLNGLGLEGKESSIRASGALLSYIKFQKRSDLKHIANIKVDSGRSSAQLDPATIRNLELLKPIHSDETGGTLISVMDKCSTTMGSRMMKKWIVRPLTDVGAINQRLDAVEWFRKELFVRSELESLLKSVSDLERVIGRVVVQRANGRDLASLRDSLKQFPGIIETLKETPSFLLKNLVLALSGFDEILDKLTTTIVDEPPVSIKDGGIIRDGVSDELDNLRDAATNGKEWIAQLQQKEREATGIDSLKIGYNKVFGYYLEASKIHSEKIPDYFIRKQTLVNAERYITPELKEMEATVLGAEEKLGDLEYELFVALREEISNHCEHIQRAAETIAIIDVLSALGRIASEQNYCRPELNESCDMAIVDGRHPVVEQMSSDPFVPNDTKFITDERQLLIITGPNMAGKSTYLRQNALIALMAQMGSFVPASEAKIGIVDRFFTRIGASDRLARGQSTFLVEMIEVANILHNATDRSLVLLDEVGRGTSTFDGVSIAWAVSEYIHNNSGSRARTLFATHYHELTELETLLPRCANLHISVKEYNDTIIFLRKIVEGGSSHSYGIQVAKLAGVPDSVIDRAKEILSNLEGMEFTADHRPNLAKGSVVEDSHKRGTEQVENENVIENIQLSIFDNEEHPVLEELRNKDIYRMTPLEALNFLAELKEKI